MISQAIQAALEGLVAERYPHLQLPAILRARITMAAEAGEWREPVALTDSETGERREYELSGKLYRYAARVVDDAQQDLLQYPAIPALYSRLRLQAGDAVLLGLDAQQQAHLLGVIEA